MNQTKGGLVSGVTLIMIGTVFLLDNLGVVDISIIWPVVPIGVGIALLIRHFISRRIDI